MSALSAGDIFVERYEVVRLLGEGGFGVVYLARQLDTDAQVAIKVMRSGMDPNDKAFIEQRDRFQREVALISRLESPYAVQLLDHGVEGGTPWMVLEFIEGKELKEVLKNGPLDPDATKRVICQVLEALADAHERGIIHRDLKPANIMLTGTPPEVNAKILDFGIAGIRSEFMEEGDQAITTHGQIRGTVAYMAPEQFQLFIDPRHESDIYAMGLILIECLTGEQAVQGASMEEVIKKQLKSPVPIPADVAAGPFGRLISKACAKDPGQRFKTATEMLDALKVLDLAAIQTQLTTDIPQDLIASIMAAEDPKLPPKTSSPALHAAETMAADAKDFEATRQGAAGGGGAASKLPIIVAVLVAVVIAMIIALMNM